MAGARHACLWWWVLHGGVRLCTCERGICPPRQSIRSSCDRKMWGVEQRSLGSVRTKANESMDRIVTDLPESLRGRGRGLCTWSATTPELNASALLGYALRPTRVGSTAHRPCAFERPLERRHSSYETASSRPRSDRPDR